MRRPVFFTLSFPPETPDWFPLMLEGLRAVGVILAEVKEENDVWTMRTAASASYIPVEIRVWRFPHGLLCRWEYSEVKPKGVRQRIGSAFGEDVNRFILASRQLQHSKSHPLRQDEGEALSQMSRSRESLSAHPQVDRLFEKFRD